MINKPQARPDDVMQLRAGHFPASFVDALEAFAALDDDAPAIERRRAACDVRAWLVAGGWPVPPALEIACGVAL